MDKPTIIAASDNKPSLQGMGRTFGESGTAIMHGIITGEEYNRRLTGHQALYWFDVMRKSEEAIQAALKAVKLPLLTVARDIVPASDSPQDKFIAAYCKRELFDRNLNFTKFAREAMTFFDFGHSVGEKTYELTQFEGKTLIGIKEIGFRKQTSIQYWQTEDGRPGITQLLTAPQDDGPPLRSIIRPKLIVWTNDQEGDNYEGISLLRYAFKSWDMADKLSLVHAIGLEKMAVPTPVIQKPPTVNAGDEESAALALQQYRSNEKAYIMLPAGWELDKFDMSGQSLAELLPALEHYEKKMLLSVLAQFLMLGMGASSSGSRATSEDHSKLFMMSEEAANKTFQDEVQKQLIEQLCDLNFSDMPNGYPKIKSSPIKEDSVTELADAMGKLRSGNLLTPTYETENYFRRLAKMPELPEDYKVDYDKRREQSLAVPETVPTVTPETSKSTDPTIKKDEKTKAAIGAARRSQRQLIDIILS